MRQGRAQGIKGTCYRPVGGQGRRWAGPGEPREPHPWVTGARGWAVGVFVGASRQ